MPDTNNMRKSKCSAVHFTSHFCYYLNKLLLKIAIPPINVNRRVAHSKKVHLFCCDMVRVVSIDLKVHWFIRLCKQCKTDYIANNVK